MNYSPAPLHIPDGFLNIVLSLISWAITIVLVGIAVRRSQKVLKDRQIPLMGIMAAFIFAAQMINFPVAGGTSGHLLGGALAAIVLGPWAGILVMTSVIGLQALLFQDGGMLVMGANILNMGVITSLIGYGLYRSVAGRKKGLQIGVVGVAAWLSVMASALLASIQIWLSGTSPARVVFPAMLGVHALIGIGEALITTAAFSFILQARPDLINTQETQGKRGYGWVIVGAVLSLLVLIGSPLASGNPDGLERVAEDLGFLSHAQDNPYNLFSDYVIPALGETGLSTILAGVVGAVAVGLIAFFVGRGLRKKQAEETKP